MVCTGNVCRSPLAAQLLMARLADVNVSIISSGTRARAGAPMTEHSVAQAVAHGVQPALAQQHSAQPLTADLLHSTDLALAMAREHRREIVEMQPSFVRKAFTVRELSRLVSQLTDDSLRKATAGASGEKSDATMLSAALGLVASQRGVGLAPTNPEDDDVIDPYGRSTKTYALASRQLADALPAIERLIRLTVS